MQARSFLHRIGITVTPCIVKIPMPQDKLDQPPDRNPGFVRLIDIT